jgi:hypothetical protein
VGLQKGQLAGAGGRAAHIDAAEGAGRAQQDRAAGMVLVVGGVTQPNAGKRLE